MNRNYILRELFITTNKSRRGLDKRHRKNGLFLGQARILRFIHQHENDDVFQSDIEYKYQIRAGSASELLNSLVKAGYLVKEALTDDKRKKRLVLTNLGIEKALEAKQVILTYENDITKGLTEEEISLFHKVINKINLEIDKDENL